MGEKLFQLDHNQVNLPLTWIKFNKHFGFIFYSELFELKLFKKTTTPNYSIQSNKPVCTVTCTATDWKFNNFNNYNKCVLPPPPPIPLCHGLNKDAISLPDLVRGCRLLQS